MREILNYGVSESCIGGCHNSLSFVVDPLGSREQNWRRIFVKKERGA
jgi:hypothetical protein